MGRIFEQFALLSQSSQLKISSILDNISFSSCCSLNCSFTSQLTHIIFTIISCVLCAYFTRYYIQYVAMCPFKFIQNSFQSRLVLSFRGPKLFVEVGQLVRHVLMKTLRPGLIGAELRDLVVTPVLHGWQRHRRLLRPSLRP